jgi:hypothetical protein
VPERAVAKRSSQRSAERSLQKANDRNGVISSPLHSRRRRKGTISAITQTGILTNIEASKAGHGACAANYDRRTGRDNYCV